MSTELLPIEFVDDARSRPMTFEEANELLQVLFPASGWQWRIHRLVVFLIVTHLIYLFSYS